MASSFKLTYKLWKQILDGTAGDCVYDGKLWFRRMVISKEGVSLLDERGDVMATMAAPLGADFNRGDTITIELPQATLAIHIG